MKKGFMRIIEVLIVLILMFSLISLIVGRNPPPVQSAKNIRLLERYAEDIKNMICNSEDDRELITTSTNIDRLNDSIIYVTPYDMQFQIVVIDPSDEQLITSTGYALPEITSGKDIATSSCIVRNDVSGITRRAVVQTWH